MGAFRAGDSPPMLYSVATGASRQRNPHPYRYERTVRVVLVQTIGFLHTKEGVPRRERTRRLAPKCYNEIFPAARSPLINIDCPRSTGSDNRVSTHNGRRFVPRTLVLALSVTTGASPQLDIRPYGSTVGMALVRTIEFPRASDGVLRRVHSYFPPNVTTGACR